MRKVVLAMHTTLNGKVDDLNAWFHGLTDDHYTEIDRRLASFDTVLVGRATYKAMVAHWSGAEAEEGGSPINKSVARKMNAYKTYVFSSSLAGPLEWNNAEAVAVGSDQDIVTFINNARKDQSGRDLYLAGGGRPAATCARLGPIDEYRLAVFPVVAPGAAWFDQIEDQRDMQLISARQYENDAFGLYFKPLDPTG